jgi:ABC-type thiamin/hydroxymethylpyrimidine transport system permease subunit
MAYLQVHTRIHLLASLAQMIASRYFQYFCCGFTSFSLGFVHVYLILTR